MRRQRGSLFIRKHNLLRLRRINQTQQYLPKEWIGLRHSQVRLCPTAVAYVGRIEVYQLRDTKRVPPGESGHLVACEGVSHQDHSLNSEDVEETAEILDERASVVSGLWLVGFAEPPPRECEHVKAVCELRCELIELVRVPHNLREKKKPLPFAAPVQVVKLDAIRSNKLALG